MKKIFLFISITIFFVIFFTTLFYRESIAKSESLGMCPMKCREDFKSAGVYDESVGIYSLICEAKVNSECVCQHWNYDVIKNKYTCLRQ